MATESEYDEIIAPMLAEVAQRCENLGMNLIARVEWQPGESGITQIGIGDTASVGQKMTQLAAHCHGNFDLLCMEAGKRFDLSQCVYGVVLDQMAT